MTQDELIDSLEVVLEDKGDPGSSQFYVSFEDNLMRLFRTR
jgi:hypothetical protein